jgi:hypothetical protein
MIWGRSGKVPSLRLNAPALPWLREIRRCHESSAAHWLANVGSVSGKRTLMPTPCAVFVTGALDT